MIQEILQNKRDEVARNKQRQPLAQIRREVEEMLKGGLEVRRFKNEITAKTFSLIAEIKRKSPSHGEFGKHIDVPQVAKVYEEANGVSCISVLTDHKYFGGSLEDLKRVRSITNKPILRKEFILEEYQIYEARKSGADAVLLISTLLGKEQLKDLIQAVRSLEMEPFIECHTKVDLDKIPFDEIGIVGINSRDLIGTLKTDLGVIKNIVPLIPKDKVIVAESGVHTASDLKWVCDLGVNAVLIGAGILTNCNISESITNLLSSVSESCKFSRKV